MRKLAENESGLTVAQENVIAALLTGKSMTAVAHHAGVHRDTIANWLRDDAAFLAAFHRARREQAEEHTMRLTALVSHALDVVEGAVAAGDVRAALTVLKGAGVLRGEQPPIGPDTAEEVQEEQDERLVARAQAANGREIGRLIAGL